MQHLFILSPGRTGTMALARAFAVQSAVIAAPHEPAPTMQAETRAYARGLLSEPEIKERFTESRPKRGDHAPGTVYVESNGHLTLIAPMLRRWYPSARFVFVARHPVSWVHSNERRKRAVTEAAMARRLAPSDFGVELPPGKPARFLPMLLALERLIGLTVGQARTLAVSYERLFDSEMSGFRQIAAFGRVGSLDVEAAREAVAHRPNASPRGDVTPFDAWPMASQIAARRIIETWGTYFSWRMP